MQLPFYYAGSSLLKTKKENDSLLISYKVFTQIVPDTVFNKIYGKGSKPRIYAMGRSSGPNQEQYLLVKTIVGPKKAVLILGFDKTNQFVAALTALRPDQQAATQQAMTLDRRFTITKTMLRRNSDGSMSEGKDVYAFGRQQAILPGNDRCT